MTGPQPTSRAGERLQASLPAPEADKAEPALTTSFNTVRAVLATAAR